MSQLQLLTRVQVYYNGNLLTREATMSLNNHSGLNRAFSIGGIAMAQGIAFCEFTVDNIVPITGFEQSTELDQQSGSVVEVTFVLDNQQTFTTDCWIEKSDLTYGVNKETMYNFSGFGEASIFQ